jgi:hypothetical protein
MTFKIDEIVWDGERRCLGLIYEGEPTEEQEQIIDAMMQAFGRLIQQQYEEADKIMASLQADGEIRH